VTATVLIVDDSTFIVEGLVALLKRSYRAIPSFGGEECLVILRTEKPDVIVLDIMMEPMDGWETLSRIKENPATRHIPVLMFSAKKISPDEAEAHRIRIDDFVTKPVQPKELIAAIEKILERDRQKKRILWFWSQKGVAREKIDEYFAITGNLDIDTSLLAVLQKQVSHPTTLPVRRAELSHLIGVLEGRIEEGRRAVDAFFASSGLALPTPEDICEPPPVAEEAPAEPACELPVSEPSTPPEPAACAVAAPSGDLAYIPCPAPEDEAVSGQPPAGLSEVAAAAFTGILPAPVAKEAAEDVATASGKSGEPAPAVPAAETPAETTEQPPAAPAPVPGSAETPGHEGREPADVVPPAAVPMASGLPIPAVHRPRAEREIPTFGAGTAAPPVQLDHWGVSVRSREPSAPLPRRGFFAGIAAALAGLFQRRKKS